MPNVGGVDALRAAMHINQREPLSEQSAALRSLRIGAHNDNAPHGGIRLKQLAPVGAFLY